MTDLPNQSNPAPSDDTAVVSPPQPPPVMISTGGKEGEGGLIPAPELPLKPVGQEVVLPKEVSQAGVSVTPQTVVLPPPVVSQGVQSVGANVPPHPTNGSTVTLPLTEEQMTKALKESVQESVRWLAEWCVRQIKKMHMSWNEQNKPQTHSR